MNILILTGKFGMGHIKCSEAITEHILDSEPDADITTVDVMDYLFPHFSKVIYKGFHCWSPAFRVSTTTSIELQESTLACL